MIGGGFARAARHELSPEVSKTDCSAMSEPRYDRKQLRALARKAVELFLKANRTGIFFDDQPKALAQAPPIDVAQCRLWAPERQHHQTASCAAEFQSLWRLMNVGDGSFTST